MVARQPRHVIQRHGGRLANRFLHVPDVRWKEIPEITRRDADVVMFRPEAPGCQTRIGALVHDLPAVEAHREGAHFFPRALDGETEHG